MTIKDSAFTRLPFDLCFRTVRLTDRPLSRRGASTWQHSRTLRLRRTRQLGCRASIRRRVSCSGELDGGLLRSGSDLNASFKTVDHVQVLITKLQAQPFT